MYAYTDSYSVAYFSMGKGKKKNGKLFFSGCFFLRAKERVPLHLIATFRLNVYVWGFYSP